MPAVNTTLYGKEGETKIPLNPKTTAEQVAIANESGGDSTVAASLF